MTDAERQASIGRGIQGIWRTFTMIFIAVFGIIEQLVNFIMAASFAVAFLSMFVAVLFAFFRRTEPIAWGALNLIIELFIQSIINSLLMSLILGFVLVGANTGNAILLLGAALVGLWLSWNLLHSCIKGLTDAIPANTNACVSVGFILPANTQTARLWFGNTAFELAFTAPMRPATVADLDVQLGRIAYTQDELTVQVALYNPTAQAIPISAEDMSLVLGLIPNPTGLAISPIVATQTIPPQSEYDLTLSFPYNGEAFATLTIFERVWAVAVR